MTKARARGWTRVVVSASVVAGCGAGSETGYDAHRSASGAPDAGAMAVPDASAVATVPEGPADAARGDDGGTDAVDASTADIPLGAPITAPDGVWTNIPFPQGYCRDGSAAHLMVHLNSASSKVAIYEEGGGACFNDTTCSVMTFDAPSYVLGQGIFNFSRADNPIRDWNIFYVPYCTGDVQAGDNASAHPGPTTGNTRFSGYTNLRLFLSRILATVSSPTDLLLAGSSAGGFGAGLTIDLVARNTPASVERVTMLDDSGAPMSSTYIPSCLQHQWRTLWGFDNTVLRDCGGACPDSSVFISDYVHYLVAKYAKGGSPSRFMAGLVSSTGDGIMSTFFGFGANNCASASSLTSAQFEAGLIELRDDLRRQTDRFGTYFYGSSAHTTLLMDGNSGVLGGLYDTQVNGVKLTDWIRDLLAHTQAPHVGP